MLPLSIRTWLDVRAAWIMDFLEPDKTLIYQRCVPASPGDPETARLSAVLARDFPAGAGVGGRGRESCPSPFTRAA